MVDLPALLASCATAALAALVAVRLAPPTPRLGPRVRPYSLDTRVSLGRAADIPALAGLSRPSTGVLRGLLGPPLEAAARWVARRLGSAGEAHLRHRITQSGLLAEVPEHRRVAEFRLREVRAVAGWAALALAAGVVLRLPGSLVVASGVLGAVAGAGRWRGRLDRAIRERQARMRIELYTVNQLLALHVRIGGGVMQALRRICQRGSGPVVEELAGVLRAHSSGVAATEALTRAARATPEPHAARTYRLLASGAEHGADLAAALLAHSEDLRAARREDLRRAATRRRAAMLVPIVGIMAPVMLLFVAAPIPQLVFGAR